MREGQTKDLYAVLGIKPDASREEIRRAYRELAKKYHPDRTGGDKAKEARFKEVGAAYEILSDPGRREQYDVLRRGGGRRPHPGAGPGMPFDIGAGGAGFALDDLLAQFFGGAGGPGRVVVEEEIPFGRRGRRGGRVRVDLGGEERTDREETLWAGGHAFVRRRDDLETELPITIEEAVLGGKVAVPTLQGTVTVSVPPGTSSGKKLRLRGKGVSGRGDLYAVVQIVVPTGLDDRARELLREFSHRAPTKIRR